MCKSIMLLTYTSELLNYNFKYALKEEERSEMRVKWMERGKAFGSAEWQDLHNFNI